MTIKNILLAMMTACMLTLVAQAEMTISTHVGDTTSGGSDVRVESQYPGSYFGGNNSLKMRNANYNNRQIIPFMRFNISSLVGFDLSNATLSNTITWESTSGTYTVDVWGLIDGANDYWDAGSLTWNEAVNLGWMTWDTGGGGTYEWYSPNPSIWQNLGSVSFTVTSGSPNLTVFTDTTHCNLDSFLNADTNGLVTLALMMGVNDHWCNYASADNVASGTYPASYAPTLTFPNADPLPMIRYMENLDRGVVAIYKGGSQVYVGWRLFGTDPAGIGFNVYRDSIKINSSPITNSTNYLDTDGSMSSTYRVAPVIDDVEKGLSSPVSSLAWSYFKESGYDGAAGYHDIPLQRPAEGTTPIGDPYTYSPNDASVGDLDGDGQYEIVLKWDPSNSHDNANSGYSGNVYLDAYEIDGTFLWRIDLGINIRAGAHYTQFMVYDLDSDGKAEIVCKTADGTTDGQGTILGNPTADYRNSSGYILDGPEYLSVFNGQTGAFIDTVNYVPARGNVCDWGDCGGNRVDRFLACVAYLDGRHPSVVMCRGYYTRTVLAAWDFADGQLSQRWVFDSDNPGNSAYAGQGNHNLSVADVDGDGKDEIIYGSCTIDDDGTGLYSTGLGHGDALHVSDMDPGRPGLEVWQCHESSAAGSTFRDAATGSIIWEHFDTGDIGRCLAAHIDSDEVGYQLWSWIDAYYGIYRVNGTQVSTDRPSMNFAVWWTADLQRELLDTAGDDDNPNPKLDKWNSSTNSDYRLLNIYKIPNNNWDTKANNSTKANPCLSGDILGDWREEMIFRDRDNTKLRIFTTTDLTSYRIYTLMHDPQYRLAIAWQNVGYNQPPHPSFYIGASMSTPPTPNIRLVKLHPDDIIEDGIINLKDFSALAAQWQVLDCADIPPCGGADLDGDYDVTIEDLLILAYNWLNDYTLQLHLKLDETSGDVAVDSSLYWRDGSLINGPVWDLGYVGGALSFDGVDDYVEVFGYPGISGRRARTVCVWIQTTQAGGMILTYGSFGTGTRWVLFVNGGKVQMGISGGNILSTQSVNDGQWHHLAAVLEEPVSGLATVQDLRLYIDGQPETGTYTNPTVEINTGIGHPVLIGVNQLSADGTLGSFFDGLIDDVRLYDRALTLEEIQRISTP